jgi:uncharacterized membrane protein
MSADELLARVDDLERKLRGLEGELREVRALARATRVAAPEPEPPIPPPRPAPPPSRPVPPAEAWWQDERGRWRGPRPEPVDEPAPVMAAAPEPAEEPRDFAWDRDVDLTDLFGAKALAWAGGVVTLLGVVFFFVLAVNRGWIGPGTRVGLGAFASLLVFTAGLVLERRYGALYSALGAVGAGIAGGYATLLAATALYDMLPTWGALLAATGVAGLGLAVSLVWSSEIVAGLGLVGALAVPALLAFQGGLTTTGTAFVALVFAAAAVTAAGETWPNLLVVSVAVSLAQIGALVLETDHFRWSRFALTAVFWALYLAAALGWQLHVVRDRLSSLTANLVVVSAGFGVLSAAWLLTGSWAGVDREGLVLAIAGLGYGALAVVFFLRARTRELGVVLAATGLAVGAIAVADLLSGSSLTYAWAVEGALLAWLAWRIAELRFQVGAFVYLGLALGHALTVEARLDRLFKPNPHPAHGVPSIALLAAAAAVAAWYASEPRTEPEPEEGPLSFLAGPLAELREAQRAVRVMLACTAGVLGLYALALTVLELFELGAGDVATWFDRGHVAVSAAWALVGLGVVVAGLLRRSRTVTIAGLVWLGVTLLKLGAYDAHELDARLRSWAFLAVGAGVLLAGYAYQLLGRRDEPLDLVAIAGSLVPLGLALSAVSTLVEGHAAGIDLLGLALLGLAGVYGALAAGAFRLHRDLSTLLWGLAVVVAAAADSILVSGGWLTLAWGASALVLTRLAVRVGERRLQLAALGYLVIALGWTIGEEAPPSALLRATEHPAVGIGSVLVVTVAVAHFSRRCLFSDPRWRSWSGWAAGMLAVYGMSLVILELFELGSGDVQTNFQRGHTGVSAFWGTLGLALLYVGLKRRLRVLRVAGFALFGVSLVKLFLYDLTFLSSITRALSFLAVGAVLLLGGFFYQRLSARLESRAA